MAQIGGCDRVQVDEIEVKTSADAAVSYIINQTTRATVMAHQGHAGFTETRRPGRISFTAVGLTPVQMRGLRDRTNATVTAVGGQGSPTVTLRNAYLVDDTEADMIAGSVPLTWEGPEVRIF